MFGMTPGCFGTYDTANKVAKAYQEEENEAWTVVVMKQAITAQKYKPIRVSDYDYSIKADGWCICDE